MTDRAQEEGEGKHERRKKNFQCIGSEKFYWPFKLKHFRHLLPLQTFILKITSHIFYPRWKIEKMQLIQILN